MSTLAEPVIRPQARGRARRIATRVALSAVALLLIVYVGISVIAANILTTPRRVVGTETPAAYGLVSQDVTFPARDGDIRLSAWYLPVEGARRSVVMVHGKDGSRSVWLRNGYAPLIAAMQERGFAVLILDMRGHGSSEDAHYSFGLNERRDVLGGVDWLLAQGFSPGSIGVFGHSMGAASSILATAEEPAIGALVQDSSYAAIAPIIEQEWPKASGLPNFLLPSTLFAGQLLFGYDIGAARPVDAIDDIAPRPVLMIHGTGDQLIPVADADALKAAEPDAELWKVPDAGHTRSFAADEQAYVERVVGFFDRNVK